jgi:ACS family hexuronate transporter-like MFS transporter
MTTAKTYRGRSTGQSGGLARPRLVTNRRVWGTTGLVIFLYIVNYADKAVLGIIAQPLARELDFTASQIGLVGSLFYLAFTIGGFLAGPLNRYLTLKWALLVVALIWSVVMLPLVLAASFAVLVASRMLLGLSEGPATALMHTAAYSWHPPAKRGLVTALLGSSASVAKIVIAPILAFVTIEYGWRVAILVLSGLGALWAVCWLIGWTEGPHIAKTVEAEDSVSAPATGDASPTQPSVPWRRIFLSRTFVTCALLAMALYALTTVVLTWLPSYFELGLGYTALQAGSLFALPSVVALVTMIASGAITDRLIQRGVGSRVARIVIASAGVLVCGAVLVTLPLIEVPVVAVVVLSLGYGSALIALPLIHSAVSELCPPQQTAGTMGMYLALMGIGGLIAPYATGVVVEHAATAADGYALAFQGVGIFVAIGGILILLFANPERDRLLICRTP